MNTEIYNKKEFLLPNSIESMSCYHAKIKNYAAKKDDLVYQFRIHDCVTGIRLTGNLNSQTDVEEAIAKLDTLATAAADFANFIAENYLKN